MPCIISAINIPDICIKANPKLWELQKIRFSIKADIFYMPVL